MSLPRTSRPTGRRPLPALVLVLTVVAAVLLPVAAGTAAVGDGSGVARTGADRVVSHPVRFDLRNLNETSVPCLADGEAYAVRARLVGPRRDVLGQTGSTRVNVLVHDAGTGSWFWRMPGRPALDYAAALARRGETSLVLDRLGYDASPLPDGDATCLGAQATMLHQVVQHLRSGRFVFTAGPVGSTPLHAAKVVVHGHGTGAAIAQLEAAEFTDVDGLVLMSWSDTGATRRALDEAVRQSSACLASAGGYTAYGASARDFRDLLFSSAPAAVQRAAAERRNAVPCGDVASLASALGASLATTDRIAEPVLLVHGSEDRRFDADSAAAQADRFSSSPAVAVRTVRGAGSALPLEAQSAQVQRAVLRWLARR